MTRDTATVRRDATLQAAAGDLREIAVGVAAGGDGKGAAGDRSRTATADGARRRRRGMMPRSRLVADVMTADVRYCRTDDSVEQVMAEMGELQVRRLPVLDASNEDRRQRCPGRPRHATIG